MYISILDYGRGTNSVIFDEYDITRNMTDEQVFGMLCETLECNEDEISFMVTDNDPIEQVTEYVRLSSLVVGEEYCTIEQLKEKLNIK